MEGVAVITSGMGKRRVEIVAHGVVAILPAPGDVVSCFGHSFSVRAIGSLPAAIVKTVLPADPRILEA